MSTILFNSTPLQTNTTMSSMVRGSPATQEQMIALTVILVILGVWSTFGNFLTIAAIATTKEIRTRTNMFILSLSISDLLSGSVASPLWLYRRTWGFHPWLWGQFACRLYWFTDEATSYCTALHIASFALWRLLGVKFPLKLESIRMKCVMIYLATLWIISITIASFYCTYYEAIVKPQNGNIYSQWPMCSNQFQGDRIAQFKVFYKFASAFLFLTPMGILFIASIFIVHELVVKKTYKSEIRIAKERRAVAQLALISISFLVGYVPMITYITWTTNTINKSKSFDYWFGVGAYLSLRFSECMNPIMYNISSKKMRDASIGALKRLGLLCSCRSPKNKKFPHSSNSNTIHSTQPTNSNNKNFI